MAESDTPMASGVISRGFHLLCLVPLLRGIPMEPRYFWICCTFKLWFVPKSHNKKGLVPHFGLVGSQKIPWHSETFTQTVYIIPVLSLLLWTTNSYVLAYQNILGSSIQLTYSGSIYKCTIYYSNKSVWNWLPLDSNAKNHITVFK